MLGCPGGRRHALDVVAPLGSGAEFLGATDLGTLEAGKWADLIVLRADPLADIRNTRQIDTVFVAGNKIQ